MDWAKKIVFIIASISLCLAIPFIPTTYDRVIYEGTDTFETHHALYGKREKTVSSVAISPLARIGLTLVNFRRAEHISPARVRVDVEGKGMVVENDITMQGVPDDAVSWVRVPADAIKKGDRYTVTVSAPDALVTAPVGVRFAKETKELALVAGEGIPLWEYVARWQDARPELAHRAQALAVGGVVLMSILFLIEVLPKKIQQHAWSILLVVLAIGSIYIRLPLTESLESAYGGDAFNYLLKSKAWLDGYDPFAADPRKAPLYALAVMPGVAGLFDSIGFGRAISMASAAGISVLSALFLRKFGLPYSLALAGGILISVNRDLQFESIQVMSNTLYAFLILAAAYVFYVGRPYLLAVLASLATLTRYEGAAALGILVPASYFIQRLPWKRLLTTIIPIAVLISIPFIMSPFSGTLGVRTFSDIAGDDGLYVVYSFDDFANNAISFKRFFGKLWMFTPHTGKPFAGFVVGLLVGCVGMYVRKWKNSPLVAAIPYVLVGVMLYIVVRGATGHIKHFVELLCAFSGVGVAAAVWKDWKKSGAIFLMVLVQIIAITAILPKERYYLQIIPFVSMALVGGIFFLGGAMGIRKRIIGPLLCVCVVIALARVDEETALSGQISDYNEKSTAQTVLLRAARYMRGTSGIVGVPDGSDLQIRSYLPNSRLIMFTNALSTPELQYKKIQEAGISYIVHTKENPHFTELIEAYPDHFSEVQTFTTRWSDDTSTLYRVY